MKLVVGLGNPGLQYARNRHNVGFMLVDAAAFHFGFPGYTSRFDGMFSKRKLGDEDVIILKPETFMNLSGRSVQKAVSYFKINIDDVIVVHDELELEMNEVKIKKGGSNKGHNGLKNIDASIGKDYWRIGIGIGRPFDKADVPNYVLSDFHTSEISNNLVKVFTAVLHNISGIISSQDKTIYNSKIKQIINDS